MRFELGGSGWHDAGGEGEVRNRRDTNLEAALFAALVLNVNPRTAFKFNFKKLIQISPSIGSLCR